MAEGSKRPSEVSRSKKEAPPMYGAEDYLRVKRELVSLGAEGLVGEINNMIKYGVDVKNGQRGKSEGKGFEPSWKNNYNAYQKEKSKRLAMFSQTSNFFRSQTLSNQRDSARMKDLMNATLSINFRSTKPSHLHTMESTGQTHVFIQQTKTKDAANKIGPEQRSLPLLSPQRREHQVRLGFLNELDESQRDDQYLPPSPPKKVVSQQPQQATPYGVHVHGETVNKAETLTSLDGRLEIGIQGGGPGRQIAAGHLQIPFIKEESRGESMYTRQEAMSHIFQDKTLNSGQVSSNNKASENQIGSNNDDLYDKKYLKLKSNAEFGEDNMRSPHQSMANQNTESL